MLVDESDFHSLHGMRVVIASLLPDLHGFVKHVAMTQVALSQNVVVGLRLC